MLLVFPTPDNLVLGPQNKAAIETLITFYNPDTTGFEITGCKSNSSLLWDGTENDSLERQLRVRNELLVTGSANMYVTGSRIFKEYEDTLSGILVFPNDFLVLGASNKDYPQDLAQTFDPETEIFSVVGCSHGKSSIDQGNEKLANGRANRLKDALMVAGISEEYIYDEGCWASQHFDEVMPRRGVLLTRKKLIDKI